MFGFSSLMLVRPPLRGEGFFNAYELRYYVVAFVVGWWRCGTSPADRRTGGLNRRIENDRHWIMRGK